MKYIFTVFITLLGLSLFAQKPGAHRVYFNELSDTTLVAYDAVLNQDNLLVVSLEKTGEDRSTGSFYLNSFSATGEKGKYDALKIIPFPEEDNYEIIDAHISLTSNTDEVNIATLMENEEGRRLHITLLNYASSQMETFVVENSTIDGDEINLAKIVQSIESTIMVTNKSNDGFTMSSHSDAFTSQWSIGYTHDTYVLNATDVTSDSINIISGIVDSGDRLFYSKFNQIGEVLESKVYGDFENIKDIQAVQNKNGGLFVIGNEADYGILLALDTIGNITWSKQLDINNAYTQVRDINLTHDQTIVIAGVYNENDTLGHFSMVVDSEGNIINALSYQNNVTSSNISQLTLVQDEINEGYILAGNGLSKMDTTLNIMWHKRDGGNISCANVIELDTLRDINTTVDTLILLSNPVDILASTTEDSLIRVDPYAVPEISVSVENSIFCPGEDIDELLTANVSIVPSDKVSYLWSTEATTDSIRGTEIDVPYTVMATIDYEECYTLYDTLVLKEYDYPYVAISVIPETNCSWRLNSFSQGGNQPLDYVWSTGETTESIEVGEGSYNLVATDQCQQQKSISVNLGVNEFSLILNVDPVDPCNSYNLSAIISGLIDVGLTYEWLYNGEVISDLKYIEVGNPGDYTFTVMDSNCNISASETVNISFEDCSVECFEFPDIFYPNASSDTEAADKTFGAVFLPGFCDIDNLDLESYELRVFNRWGQEVFSTEDVMEQWNGKYKDENAPSEVYAFYAIYKYIDGEEKLVKGDVTLVR